MQFQVPQFIEVEDKIFGPLTFKQFVYIAGGLGISYLLYRVLPIYLGAPLIVGTLGLAVALSFMQWNGRPFILALEHGFYYVVHPKLYLWNNKRKTAFTKQAASTSPSGGGVYVPRLSESKLRELSWSLDINERIEAGIASEEDRERVVPRESIVAPIRTARDALVR